MTAAASRPWCRPAAAPRRGPPRRRAAAATLQQAFVGGGWPSGRPAGVVAAQCMGSKLWEGRQHKFLHACTHQGCWAAYERRGALPAGGDRLQCGLRCQREHCGFAVGSRRKCESPGTSQRDGASSKCPPKSGGCREMPCRRSQALLIPPRCCSPSISPFTHSGGLTESSTSTGRRTSKGLPIACLAV